LLSNCNGVLIPNGDSSIFENSEPSEYSQKVSIVYEYAKY